MTSRFERVASVILTVAAVGMCVAVVHREFSRGGGGQSAAPSAKLHFIKDWHRVLGHGRWLGDSTNSVVFVEFADYECPFCRRIDRSLSQLDRGLKDSISVYYIDFPLAQHRFAKPAALAAECAGSFEAYGPFHDVLFAKQDSLGLKSWASYAADAGIADTVAFARCVRTSTASPLVASGMSIGQAMNVRGTPTILINGWAYDIPPYDSLAQVLRQYTRKSTGRSS